MTGKTTPRARRMHFPHRFMIGCPRSLLAVGHEAHDRTQPDVITDSTPRFSAKRGVLVAASPSFSYPYTSCGTPQGVFFCLLAFLDVAINAKNCLTASRML